MLTSLFSNLSPAELAEAFDAELAGTAAGDARLATPGLPVALLRASAPGIGGGPRCLVDLLPWGIRTDQLAPGLAAALDDAGAPFASVRGHGPLLTEIPRDVLEDDARVRDSLLARRCVLVVSGYSQVMRPASAEEMKLCGVSPGPDEPLRIAGVFVEDPEGGGAPRGVAIITTESSGVDAPAGARRPVSIPRALVPLWLDGKDAVSTTRGMLSVCLGAHDWPATESPGWGLAPGAPFRAIEETLQRRGRRYH